VQAILGKWSEEVYVVFRFMMGFMIGCHGVQKVFGLLDGEGPAKGLFLVAGVMETLGGPLVMAGLFTSPIALLLSGEMAVAYWMVHVPKGGFFPLLNGGDTAILFCFVFLYIAAAGPGPWALNRR